jgi:hypothetical protein
MKTGLGCYEEGMKNPGIGSVRGKKSTAGDLDKFRPILFHE